MTQHPTFEKIQSAAQLAAITIFVLTFIVFFQAPVDVLRGEASGRRQYIFGFLGMAFWVIAAKSIGGAL